MKNSYTILLLLFTTSCVCFEDELGVLGKIKAGFEIAGKFLGINRSNTLAQLVSQTFSVKTKDHVKQSASDNYIFSGFLRLLGLDTKKLSAIAVNAIIFVAQLISTSLSKSPPAQITNARKLNTGTPMDWMLNNPQVVDMLKNIKDTNLANNVVEYIKEKSFDEETDCIQLLICKTAPLIWGMQKSINSTSNKPIKGRKALYSYLPTVQEFEENAEICEKQHPYCLIYY